MRSLIEEDNDEEDDGDGGGGDEGGDGDGHLEDPEYAHHPYKTKHFPSSADHQGVLHHQDQQDHHDHHRHHPRQNSSFPEHLVTQKITFLEVAFSAISRPILLIPI